MKITVMLNAGISLHGVVLGLFHTGDSVDGDLSPRDRRLAFPVPTTTRNLSPWRHTSGPSLKMNTQYSVQKIVGYILLWTRGCVYLVEFALQNIKLTFKLRNRLWFKKNFGYIADHLKQTDVLFLRVYSFLPHPSLGKIWGGGGGLE
jgi:hypothetical protein